LLLHLLDFERAGNRVPGRLVVDGNDAQEHLARERQQVACQPAAARKLALA
jgi:hypothetical protein